MTRYHRVSCTSDTPYRRLARANPYARKLLREGLKIPFRSQSGTIYYLNAAALAMVSAVLTPTTPLLDLPFEPALLDLPNDPTPLDTSDEVLTSFAIWIHGSHPYFYETTIPTSSEFLVQRLPHMIRLYTFARRYAIKKLRNAIVTAFWYQVVINAECDWAPNT